MSLDTAMYIQSEGRERTLVAVRPETPQAPVEREPDPDPDPELEDSINQPADIEMNAEEYVLPKKN